MHAFNFLNYFLYMYQLISTSAGIIFRLVVAAMVVVVKPSFCNTCPRYAPFSKIIPALHLQEKKIVLKEVLGIRI